VHWADRCAPNAWPITPYMRFCYSRVSWINPGRFGRAMAERVTVAVTKTG
jgi:hypothetical protein